jgi:hypothetical protein
MKNVLTREINRLLQEVSKEELRRNKKLRVKTKKLKELVEKLSVNKGER